MSSNKISFEYRLLLLTLVTSVPSTIAMLVLMLNTGVSVYLNAILAILMCLLIAWCAIAIVSKTRYLFGTIANLLDAMSSGDYSLKGKQELNFSALGSLMAQINNLSDTLARQHLEVKQQQLLVNKIISQIDVAIVAFDQDKQISLLNPSAKKLLGDLKCAEDLKLQSLLDSGKYRIHSDQFIEDGKSNQLWFITDVRDLLRAEERKTWQNLIRVLSHEINNSLTPIASISQTLQRLITRNSDPETIQTDIKEGLQIINERANSLGSFIESYRHLSRLPQPKLQRVNLSTLLSSVIGLFEHREIHWHQAQPLEVTLDPIQFEQLLINLLKNADEAMQESDAHKNSGEIDIECLQNDGQLSIIIRDQGSGIGNSANLFTPFYTTKAQGSGTGLLLSRQIVEAHGGDLSIGNRHDRLGCEVVIKLPLHPK